MLITFQCRAYANITMLGESGMRMLEMMGFGTRVPGAIRAADLEQALQNLRNALAALPQDDQPPANGDDEEPVTSLHTRALPLIELLQAAIADDTPVRWE